MAETFFSLLRQTEKRLEAAGIENARQEARILTAFSLGRDESWLLAHRSDPVTGDFSRLYSLTERRCTREPLQYILGSWSFCGREFRVGKGVLIPREDTETVIESVSGLTLPEKTALDLCAGTGCIGITLALEFGLSVTEVEISPEAEFWLAQNIEALAPKLRMLHGNVLDPLFLSELEPVGLIVSNPPYIPEKDMADLDPEVRYEPFLALNGGTDGLAFYRAILKNASLLPGGWFVFEVGIHQAEPVAYLMEERGCRDIHTRTDFGGIPRAVAGRI